MQILRLHMTAWQVTTLDKIHQRAQSTTALVWYAQQVSLACLVCSDTCADMHCKNAAMHAYKCCTSHLTCNASWECCSA